MEYQQICAILVVLACIPIFSYGQYSIPEVKFEAFDPRGLRVSIPAEKGVQMFAFHGNINQPIKQIEPGEIVQDVTTSTNGRFVYVDPNLKLKKDDEINYWVFVQHDQLGFRKEELKWKVDKLLPLDALTKGSSDNGCGTNSVSVVAGQEKVCSGDKIIDYKFSEKPVDSNLWLIEQYIPGNPDWLFNIYRNSPDIIDIENNVLRIKPKLEEENAKKDLNLNPGCTRTERECNRPYISIWNPPVVSGKIVSKTLFSFGNITIRAKLPIGDYMYPEIYLEDPEKPERRIVIAYARGNKDYLLNNGVDDGATKLFAGPYSKVTEPEKSKYLSTYQSTEPIGNSWHTFSLLWKPNNIEMFIDGQPFGNQLDKSLRETGFSKPKMVRLVLGVGVGGPYEFPDGYTSSGQKKPYKTTDRHSVRDFLLNKSLWINSWTADSQLQVDYVSVTAL